MAQTTGKGALLKAGLLITSITMGTQMAISPALPEIMTTFPEKTTRQVETLTTVQSITALVLVLLSPLIASYLSKKRTVILGLLVAGIAGIVPALSGVFFSMGISDLIVFRIMWLSRLVYGAGVGLVCGMAVTMIGDFFEGDERASMLGIRSSMETLGQVATTALAGVLLSLGWMWPFAVYAVIFVALAVFLIGVPQDEPTAGKSAAAGASAGPQVVTVPVLVLCALNYLFITCYSSLNVRIPSIMTEGGFGTASQSSLVISVLAITGMVFGLLFGVVFKALRGKTAAVGMASLALSCLLAGIATSMPLLFASAVLAGAAFPLFVTFAMNRVSEVAEQNSIAISTSVCISSGFLAGFFCPYILSSMARVVGDAAAAPFIPYAIMLAGITVLCFFLYGGDRK